MAEWDPASALRTLDDPSLYASEDRPVCKRFLRRRCTFGSSCKFLHPGEDDLLRELLAAPADWEAEDQVFAETAPPQCLAIIHGQRRCKNAAVIDTHGFCAFHAIRQAELGHALVTQKRSFVLAEGAILPSRHFDDDELFPFCREDTRTGFEEDTRTINTPAPAPAPPSTSTKRISASHKRMTNPESVLHPPFPIKVLSEKNSLIVDIGAARGQWINTIAPKMEQSLCVGLELRQDLVEAAGRVKQKNAEFRTMNCKNERHWEALGRNGLVPGSITGRFLHSATSDTGDLE